ncbi:MAG: hypothetical protein ACJA2S_002832 [Cyclobacteriaceae bacterium]|jgi:hypothetical protein
MNSYRKIFIMFSAILLISTIAEAGGGWTQKKGTTYAKLNQFGIVADSYFNPEGNIIPVQPTISFYSTSLYAEYGITDRLTGILYFPFFSRSVLNNLEKLNGDFMEGDELNSIGDTDLSLKYGLVQDKSIVVSTSLTLGLPLGVSAGGETGSLSTGDGEFNQMITVEASHSFYPFNAYVTALVGFNNRTQHLSDEIRYGLEAGYTYKKLIGIVRMYAIKSMNNASAAIDPVQGLFSNRVEYMSMTYQLAYNFTDKFGLTVSKGTAFTGKRILADPSYSVGVYFNF